MNINMAELEEQFNNEYQFLYDNNDNVSGYREALEEGNDFLKNHGDFVRTFVKYRGDFISSDREVVAFMFALNAMANI